MTTDVRRGGAAFRPGARRLTTVAQTGPAYASFGPYVPAMGEDGRVAFQSALSDGGSGVFVADPAGEACACILHAPAGEAEVNSHPDIDGPSACCYVKGRGGDAGLWMVRREEVRIVAPHCGPLGPTMAGGRVAYRGVAADGAGVFLWDGARSIEIDRADDEVAGFEGLPVVTPDGAVLYRVALRDGGHDVRLYKDGQNRAIARTGPKFTAIGRFPMINARHEAVVAATARDGRDGLYVWRDGTIEQVATAPPEFESIRGGLIGNDGTLFIIGTARGGGLGVFADAQGREPIVQVGMPLLGSSVNELALNPVSVNGAGQVAIRIGLADGRGVIVRSDPAG